MSYLNKAFLTFSVLCFFFSLNGAAQSFNQEKVEITNYLKRVYASEPFEGTKKIESADQTFFSVAVKSISNSSISDVLKTAQQMAEMGFTEPCIGFEMLFSVSDTSVCKTASIFLCETLGNFLLGILKKKPFDGARIVSAPNNKYIVSVITLDNAKYSSPEMRDKAGHMKAKQFVNILVNGSTISSETIIRTDETDKATEITNTEIVKEQAMGFINGLELLTTKEITPNKTTYLYFSKLNK